MIEKVFPQNEHTVDRLIRVVLGVALLTLTILPPHSLWGLVGLLPLVTGVAGSCPLYRLFGIDTCRIGQGPAAHT